MKKFILSLSKKHPTLYGVIYLFMFLLLLTMISFLPYIYRAVSYPLFYEKEINDTDVRVTPSIAREYEKGDVYNYIQYTRGEKVIGDSREYSLLWGIFALLMEILIGCTAVSYFRVSTKEDAKKEKEAIWELPQPADGKALSTKELYELCLLQNVHVMKGKRNNRQYLEHCLRNARGQRSFSRRWREEQERKNGPARIIFLTVVIVALLVVMVNYVKFIYYFVYLFA